MSTDSEIRNKKCVKIAEIDGLIPCDEWRSLEWDGVVSTFCPNSKHQDWSDGGRMLCYCVGIREGFEHTDKNNLWNDCKICRIPDECTYSESRAELYAVNRYFCLDSIIPVIKRQIQKGDIDENDILEELTKMGVLYSFLATPEQFCDALLKAKGIEI